MTRYRIFIQTIQFVKKQLVSLCHVADEQGRSPDGTYVAPAAPVDI